MATTLAGNLTTIKLDSDEPIVARYPSITAYLPAGQDDWAPQREVAATVAQETFWSMTGRNPAWCVPENEDHWLSILAVMTLVVIFRSFRPTIDNGWLEEAKRWAEIAEGKLKVLRYREDEDQDGTISDRPQEDVQTVRSLILRR